MKSFIVRSIAAFAASSTALLAANTSFAIGESVAGFPNYDERVLHMLANRARVAPEIETTACGANCPDAACYTAKGPLYYKRELNHAARFHAAHMSKNKYFAHTSSCTIVPDIGTLYPDSCDGSAACACVGGMNACNAKCTGFSERIGLFGSDGGGEIIASTGQGAEHGFYLWLYEPTASAKCEFSSENGHRWLLLTADGAIGFGSDGKYVGDFGSGGEEHPIASGSHWPRQADTVETWASWFAPEGPKSALVNVDGSCSPMKLSRGTIENGAYEADITGVGQGCHRYFFVFKDAAGALVTFPETGSLGIGPADTCADFSAERPATGAGCECVPQCDGKQCGDDSCGGSCGTCGEGASCSAALQCVTPDAADDASCGCAVPGDSGKSGAAAALALLGLVFGRRSRLRSRTL